MAVASSVDLVSRAQLVPAQKLQDNHSSLPKILALNGLGLV